jgi:hypothetical protein
MELSQNELQRLKVIENAVQGRIKVQQASGLPQLGGRQVKRLKARYDPEQVEWEARPTCGLRFSPQGQL